MLISNRTPSRCVSVPSSSSPRSPWIPVVLRCVDNLSCLLSLDHFPIYVGVRLLRGPDFGALVVEEEAALLAAYHAKGISRVIFRIE